MNNTEERKKRTSHYIAPPSSFEVAPCPCGNTETQWSEWESHLWCDKCQKDFIPEHNGVFEGPICINAAQLMGFSFDLYLMETDEIEFWDAEQSAFVKKPAHPKDKESER